MRVGEERAVSMKSCGAVKERATLLKDSKTTLTIGLELTQNIKMSIESLQEAVTVIGEAPVVEPAGGAKREPAFQVTRITQLRLVVPKLEPSASYYRKLLGEEADKPRKGTFRVGPSELVLGPGSGGESFRVGVMGFDPSITASKLKNLGVAVDARDKISVSFRDGDGIRVHIGG